MLTRGRYYHISVAADLDPYTDDLENNVHINNIASYLFSSWQTVYFCEMQVHLKIQASDS